MATKPENMAETANSAGVTQEPAADFNGADPAKFDHDGDGKPGGSIASAVVGEVVKKGKAAPKPEDLGDKPDTRVLVRITEKGHGKVHNGAGGRYDHGDEVVLPLSVAQSLRGNPADKKALGYVEILAKA